MSIFLAKRIIANLRDNSSLDSVNTKDTVLPTVLPENSTEKKKQKYTQKKCPHGKQRSKCVSCGGSEICIHHKLRRQCVPCGGSAICIHRKRRDRCVPCGGSQICSHGKRRDRCVPCGGSEICVHSKQRSSCVSCGGSSICSHGKQRHRCVPCGGSAICIHGKRRDRCVPCGGSQICSHGKRRDRCLICSPLPMLQCDYPLCGYETKRKDNFQAHAKIHSEEYAHKRKKQEALIAEVLTKNNILYTREHTVTYKCISDIKKSNSRIDFVLEHRDQQGTFGLIFLEVDEHQHKWNMLSCEISRMSKIIESLRVDGNMLPIRFVRYNPDAFTVNGAKMKMKQDERHRMLLQTLTATVFERPFGVKYLFYDSDENERPCVLKDSDYFESFKSFVL